MKTFKQICAQNSPTLRVLQILERKGIYIRELHDEYNVKQGMRYFSKCYYLSTFIVLFKFYFCFIFLTKKNFGSIQFEYTS